MYMYDDILVLVRTYTLSYVSNMVKPEKKRDSNRALYSRRIVSVRSTKN